MTTPNGHSHEPAPGVLPPQSEAESAVAQLSMMMAQGQADPYFILGRKEARLATVEQALAAAIEELKKWAALGLPYEVIATLVNDHKHRLADLAAAEAVANAHAPAPPGEVVVALGNDEKPAKTSETFQNAKGK